MGTGRRSSKLVINKVVILQSKIRYLILAIIEDASKRVLYWRISDSYGKVYGDIEVLK